MSSSLRFLWVALCCFLPFGTVRAHQPYEVTSVARLQHGRLELSVTLSLVMANFLLNDPDKPEAERIDAATFDHHRKRLQTLASGFYRVKDGASDLAIDKVLVFLNRFGEPEFRLFYPAPKLGPLEVEATGLKAPGQEGAHTLRVYDDAEALLGTGTFENKPGKDRLSFPLTPPASTTPEPQRPIATQ